MSYMVEEYRMYGNTLSFDIAKDNFSKNIKYLLSKRQMSQTALKIESGVSQPQISKIISGEKIPTMEQAFNLSKALMIPLDTLFGFDLEALNGGDSYDSRTDEFVRRDIKMPSCTIDRYSDQTIYMYYYTTKDKNIVLEEATIKTNDVKNLSYISGCLSTTSHDYTIKLVAEFPFYICIYGTNVRTPSRFFIMFSDPDYDKNGEKFDAAMALCTSVFPERIEGLPATQVVLLSGRQLSKSKLENIPQDLFTVPAITKIICLNNETKERLHAWIKKND